MYETLPAQQRRFQGLQARNGDLARSMFRLNETMLALASAGDVESLDELVTATPQDCILYWFTRKMFHSACQQGRLDMVGACALRGGDVLICITG
jgi:hypothetical protein